MSCTSHGLVDSIYTLHEGHIALGGESIDLSNIQAVGPSFATSRARDDSHASRISLMSRQVVKTLATAIALAAAGTASAVVITTDSSWNGVGTKVIGDISVSACNSVDAGACTHPGTIGTKAIPDVGLGAGVQGQGNNEIDWYPGERTGNSEMLRFTFGTASVIDSFELGLLFDGPEYTDFQEIAQFLVSYEGGGSSLFRLSTVFATPGVASWDGFGSWSGEGVVNGGSGLWKGTNPFGSTGVLQIDLFASPGTCGTNSACNDQSDFVFRSLKATPVPEPGTLALLGAGLLGLSLSARRRKAS